MSTDVANKENPTTELPRRPVGPLAPLELTEKMQHAEERKSDQEPEHVEEEHKGEKAHQEDDQRVVSKIDEAYEYRAN